MKKEVWVRHEFVGFHHWPEAPEEVKYLASIHRHLFKIEVAVEVDNNDRQVEFHLLKKDVLQACRDSLYLGLPEYLCTLSCEAIAERLHKELYNSFGNTNYNVTRITVSEDGECGATLTWG